MKNKPIVFKTKRLELEAAAMRDALAYCRDYVQHSPCGKPFRLAFVESALRATAGYELSFKLERYRLCLKTAMDLLLESPKGACWGVKCDRFIEEIDDDLIL